MRHERKWNSGGTIGSDLAVGTATVALPLMIYGIKKLYDKVSKKGSGLHGKHNVQNNNVSTFLSRSNIHNKNSKMAHLLLPAALGLPGLIGGIMSAVEAGKRLSGGRVRRAIAQYKPKRGGKVARRKLHKRRAGRGIAADIFGSIPLLGSIAGPLVRALGGKIRRHKGRGLVPMHIYQPIAQGAGLLGPGMAGIYPRVIKHHATIGKTSSGRMIPIVGGLLSPTGIGSSVRRGHYRYVNGKRVHVSPTIVRGSGGKLRKRRINKRK